MSDSTHLDVIVVGAGISGIGAAYHLTDQCPGTSFAVLETQESFGGTWLTHTYPGVRSDSDLFTFGYRFKPWTGNPIASAQEILDYMGEVIDDNDLGQHIRYQHKITKADWSNTDNLWTLEVTRLDTSETLHYTTNFLWMCQGYYRHDQGYTPEWDGFDDYKGEVIHPQTWPEDADLKGKKVICIGSGATAATLIPAIADECDHVIMLQRSPTYFHADRNHNELAETLREINIQDDWIHEIVRKKIIHDSDVFMKRAEAEPDVVKAELLAGVRHHLGPDYDIDKHFTPSYRPWQQRLAFIPDADLFKGIRSGKASVMTEHIVRFTENGILLQNGEELEADIIITATGFNLSVMGDIPFSIDGEPLNWSETVTYRGMMFTGVPNLVWVFGYFRASWTLRADIVSDFVCRLLDHMKEKGAEKVVPTLRPEDDNMPILPWIDEDNFNPGYMTRSMHLLPKRGNKPEWAHTQDYNTEKDLFPEIDLEDAVFVYG